ncbi:HNH endonuclease [Chloroflexota bacterium]
MLNRPVLVLNQSYEPLNICRTRRALVLVLGGKAEMVENGSGFVLAANGNFPLPSVIRLYYQIKRPRPQPKLTRAEVFNRDKYTCQYCGKVSHQLTLDHVMPRHLGGKHTWENLITACSACNLRKAGKTLKQAGMKLMHNPARPVYSNYIGIPNHLIQVQHQWQKYIIAGN